MPTVGSSTDCNKALIVSSAQRINTASPHSSLAQRTQSERIEPLNREARECMKRKQTNNEHIKTWVIPVFP